MVGCPRLSDLPILRAVALKGMTDAARLAEALALVPASAQRALEELEQRGLTAAGPRGHRLSDAGRAQLTDLLEAEREDVDAATVAKLYAEFGPLNTRFKQTVTDFQLAGEDGDAQARSLKRLSTLHSDSKLVVADLVELAPRLRPFSQRFERALQEIRAGDTRYVASPLVDSYHTIWFELHEELIHLAGRTRSEQEA